MTTTRLSIGSLAALVSLTRLVTVGCIIYAAGFALRPTVLARGTIINSWEGIISGLRQCALDAVSVYTQLDQFSFRDSGNTGIHTIHFWPGGLRGDQ